MDDTPPPHRRRSLRLPANSHEFWALALSLLSVLVLVQLGAPIIREFEFLDPKLREYFIGISFAAFPLIHRTYKQNLVRLTIHQQPVKHDSTPWYTAPANGVPTEQLLMDPTFDRISELLDVKELPGGSVQWTQKAGDTMVTIVTKLEGNRQKTWSSMVDDGTQLISNGKFSGGGEPPWFNKCETN